MTNVNLKIKVKLIILNNTKKGDLRASLSSKMAAQRRLIKAWTLESVSQNPSSVLAV